MPIDTNNDNPSTDTVDVENVTLADDGSGNLDVQASGEGGIEASEASGTPNDPASGARLLYPDSDGYWTDRDDAGSEAKLGLLGAIGFTSGDLVPVTTIDLQNRGEYSTTSGTYESTSGSSQTEGMVPWGTFDAANKPYKYQLIVDGRIGSSGETLYCRVDSDSNTELTITNTSFTVTAGPVADVPVTSASDHTLEFKTTNAVTGDVRSPQLAIYLQL